MKKIILNTLLLGSIIIVIGSCTKKTEYTADRTFVDPTTNSLLKINYSSAYVNNPSVQLSVNGQRVSGLITGRTPFPGGGYNTNGSNFPDYLAVTPGSTILTIAIPKKNTNTDSVVLFTTNFTLAVNTNYTVHVTDTLTNTKVIPLVDNLSLPDLGTSKYRFVNMMPNAPYVDLYYNTTLLAARVPYLGSSEYFTYPIQTVAGTWSIRESGTLPTSTAMATYSSLNTTVNQRVFTAFASGYKGATATTTKPYISFLLNQ